MKTFKELLDSAALMRRDLPPTGQDFCELLETHGEVLLDLASGKRYSVHLGDMGGLDAQCLTVRLFDGRSLKINWLQIETVWVHLASEEN